MFYAFPCLPTISTPHCTAIVSLKLGFHDGICGITSSKIRGIENWNTLYQTIPHGNVEVKIGITPGYTTLFHGITCSCFENVFKTRTRYTTLYQDF